MKLYHGTNVSFDEIDLTKTKPAKDFGQGFYLTDILSQAQELAKKKAMILGGESIVQEYDFDESHLTDADLKVLRFDGPSVEWAEFIYKNRMKHGARYTHDYDIVIGPIADDGVAYLLDRYDEETITLEELAEQLKYKKLNRQYYFGNYKVIQLLKRIK
jgi:hypothetical protein